MASSSNLPAAPVDVDRPTDRRVVVGVAALTFVLGLVLTFTGKELMHSLQRCFLLGGLALIGFWAMSAVVKTEQARIRLRSSVIGVVVGLLPVGLIGMIALLVS